MNKNEMEEAIYSLRLRMARIEQAVEGLAAKDKLMEIRPVQRSESDEPSSFVTKAELTPEASPLHAPPLVILKKQPEPILDAARMSPVEEPVSMSDVPVSAGTVSECPEPPRMEWLLKHDSVKPDQAAKPARSLEMLIGMNWMAWAGSILVVLAVGFFVKLAYDQGWFGRIPPLGKCTLAAMFGGLLLAAGEFALRRINRPAAASLYGAGLGTLYLTAFATFKWFGLLSAGGAFWLLLLVALLGFAITARARLITTGLLSTIGGYLTPILLHEASAFPAALPLYLSMLLTLALSLSAWNEKPFRILRYTALCCHAFIGSVWVLHEGPAHWPMALIFMAIWWCLANAECILAALRGQTALGNPIASLFVTAWIAVIGHQLITDVQPTDRDYLGLFAVSLAALAALPAALVGPGIKMLQHRPKRAVEKLGVTLWAQAGVLLATAIGFQFDDFGQTIGWLALGYACVEVGRKLPSRGVDWFGLGVGALALARVAFMDSTLRVLQGTFWSYGDIQITYWGLLAAGAVLTVYLSAIRLQCLGFPPRVKLPIFLMGLGTFGWLVICGTQIHGMSLYWGWLAAAAVLLASHHVGRRHRCFFFGRAVLWVAAIKWLGFDGGLQTILDERVRGTIAPVLNYAFAVGVVIAAGIAVVTWLRYRREQIGVTGRIRWQSTLNVGVLFVLLALTYQLEYALEFAQARGWQPIWSRGLLTSLSITALWMIAGATIIVVSWRTRNRQLHSLGWVLAIVSALAWLSYETLIWRVDNRPIVTRPMFNLQAGVGLLVIVLLSFVAWREPRVATSGWCDSRDFMVCRTLGWSMVALAGLWLGSLEIDRFFALPSTNPADAAMARQTAFSIYWGVYALVLLALGFAKRTAAVRYAGLGLLTITLGKVLIVDLAKVEYVYRVLSFLGVGILLMATSVAYAKLSKRLFGEEIEPAQQGD